MAFGSAPSLFGDFYFSLFSLYSPASVHLVLFFFKNISCLYVDWCVWWVSCLHVPLVPAEVSRGQAEPLELELWILVNNHVLGTEPGPLLEQPGLFATEPSLQPLVLFFRWFFSHLLDGCDQLRVYKHLVFGCFSSLCSLPPCWNIRQVFILFPLPNKSLEKRESLSAQVLMRALSLPDVSWFLILNKEITIWRRHNSLKWPQQFLIWELVAVTQQNSLAGRKEVKVCNSDLVIFPPGLWFIK